MDNEVVWVFDEECYGILVQRNAYYSIVRISDGGLYRDIEVDNDDYISWEDRATEYESEE